MAVMPAKAGIQYAVRPQSITHISEYWIIPFADDDGWTGKF
jgi:hypothetical protein